MHQRFRSDGLSLAAHVSLPVGRDEQTRIPGLVMCHGFPVGPLDARRSAGTFPELADRIASEMGWAAMAFTFRGCGDSEGDFSMAGWADDLRAALDYLWHEVEPSGLWLVGTSTGAALAICAAAEDARVQGAALLGAAADFEDWAAQPRRFLEHARDIGAIRHAGFPRSFDVWARELRMFYPLDAARRFAPRPLLILHGEDDTTSPVSDARRLAQAHGAAELRVFDGAGHRLRHDPRAIAVLLGWLDRQANAAAGR